MSYDAEQDYYDDDGPVRKKGSMSPVLLVLIIVGAVVFIPFVAALVGMVTLVIPKGQEAKHRVHCMNNLRQIGGMLVAKDAGEGLKLLSGPAFLLQVVDDLHDEDLDVFICPGEPEGAAPNRPPIDSAEFIQMYRDLKPSDLTKDLDWSRYTSYAGPDFEKFPLQRRTATRLWACDACVGGHPHHDGIVVLYNSSKVDFLKPENLEGMIDDEILVGPRSPDPRLEKMIYAPKR